MDEDVCDGYLRISPLREKNVNLVCARLYVDSSTYNRVCCVAYDRERLLLIFFVSMCFYVWNIENYSFIFLEFLFGLFLFFFEKIAYFFIILIGYLKLYNKR